MAVPLTRAKTVLLASVTAGGGLLLRRALASPPASPAFHRRTTAVAAVWLGGSLLGTRPRFGADRLTPLKAAAFACGAFAAFATGALVVRRVPALDRAVGGVLVHATAPSPAVLAVALANGAAEELFFRGTWFDRLPTGHAVAGSAVIYTGTTAATGNPALVLAAAVMGTLFGVRRHRTGTVLEPLLIHLLWSVLMIQVLPRVHGAHRRPGTTG